MGIQELQNLELKYEASQINEQKEIFDLLEELEKKGVIEEWKLDGTEERPTTDESRTEP